MIGMRKEHAVDRTFSARVVGTMNDAAADDADDDEQEQRMLPTKNSETAMTICVSVGQLVFRSEVLEDVLERRDDEPEQDAA